MMAVPYSLIEASARYRDVARRVADPSEKKVRKPSPTMSDTKRIRLCGFQPKSGLRKP